jgi:hypothetical protein
MKNSSFLSEAQLVQAADQLVIDERQERICHATRLAGVLDEHNFKLEWTDQELTTGFTLRGIFKPEVGTMTYSFSLQELSQPASSRLRFNENAAVVRVIDGPLQINIAGMAFEQEQTHLSTIVYEALGDLILDSYKATPSSGTP